MKKTKLLLSAIILCIFVASAVLLSQSFTSVSDGTLKVELISLDDKIIKEKDISFKEGNLLLELIEDNFNNVSMSNGMIMTIESLETTSDYSQFISIYVNDQMSEVGLEDIQYTDGTKISFILTEFNNEY